MQEMQSVSNFTNYYIYAELVKKGKLKIDTRAITRDNWNHHFQGVLNILRDGIEMPAVQGLFVEPFFEGNQSLSVELNIMDYLLNLMMWFPIVYIEQTIKPEHLFFEKFTTADAIKAYIDKNIIDPNKISIENKLLNNAIADTVYHFSYIDEFALFLANTLNLEDDIDIMQKSKDYFNLLHADLSNVPIGEVKDKGMELVHDAIDNYIMKSNEIVGYDHCLKYAFGAQEGINIRQYKENNINIGTKPDGQGSIYHDIINSSYINGGLNNLVAQYIDNGASRVAQIISKKNVGESGGFSRILGLNNMDTHIHPDKNYDCGTKNFVHITVKDKKHLSMLDDRYFRFERYGLEFKIKRIDYGLIGQKIWLRSPITCKSHAEGHGVCYKCYGDLGHTNKDISIGRIATELITSQYTQKRLSAKHLLETVIKIIKWVPQFNDFFEVANVNEISLKEDIFKNKQMSGWKLRIKTQDIQLENDDEFFKHRSFSDDMHASEDDGPFVDQFINNFEIITPDDEVYTKITAVGEDGNPIDEKLYISNKLAAMISKAIEDEDIVIDNIDVDIPLNELQDIELFLLKIQNNDLGKSLDIFTDTINKKAVTKSYDKDTIVEALQDAAIQGGVKCQSIHLETIMASQICADTSRLEMPDWSNPDAKYEILTLNEALTDNKSVIVSLDYQKLAKALFYPLNKKKTAPSILDPFFMDKPKKFLNAQHEVWAEVNKPKIKKGECPIAFNHDHKGKKAPRDVKAFLAPFRNEPKTELD